jgi:hypothetical protein
MRVMSSFVLAAWLVGGVAAPCLVRDGCASPARHKCCCGHAGDCCCLLTASRAPASSSNVASLPTTPDLLGLPAIGTSALPAGARAASEGGATRAADPGRVPSLHLCVASHAFRC